MKDSIGDRMKNNYENRSRFYLSRRIPVIIRLDGKAHHTLTKNCNKPFDYDYSSAIENVAVYLVQNIQGCKCAYTQSDEISLLLTDFDTINTEAWFDYNINKINSVSASMSSVIFNYLFKHPENILYSFFDSRSFNIPKEEVANYFIWRQIDWIRNSLHMLAYAYFSHSELQNKNQSDMHEMLYKKDINWADLDVRWKNGTFIYRDEDNAILSKYDIYFKNDKSIFERYLYPRE